MRRAALALAATLALAGGAPASAAEGGACKAVAKGACLELAPKTSGEELTLERNGALPPEKLRDFCPNVVRVSPAAGGERKRVELPETSFLYDTSDCCPGTQVTLGADPRRRRFTLRGVGRDCFGGTAHFDVEEVYRLETSGAAKLIRRIDRSDQLEPKPE